MAETHFSKTQGNEIRVKFLHRGFKKGQPTTPLIRQFPMQEPTWGKCHFIFDIDCRNYDWLVVYHDLPGNSGWCSEEHLACPRENTLLLTGEPSTITVFGYNYLNQFGHILTFQEPWAIHHPHPIFHHPGLIWYYGLFPESDRCITWDELAAMPPPVKSKEISTICSSRTGRTTLHSARVAFTHWLKEQLPELEVFGHGVRPIKDKSEALDAYKYHLTIENHVYPHHLTEKLPDAFLGYTLPFYHGAPNAADYFPKESFIPIDFTNRKKTLEIIRYHIRNNEYHDRLPYIIEARQRVLEKENLFAIIARTIEARNKPQRKPVRYNVIRNRSTMRIKNPYAGIRSLTEGVCIKSYHRISRLFSSLRKNSSRISF